MKIVESNLQSQSAALQWQYRRQESSLEFEVRLPEPQAVESTTVSLSPEALVLDAEPSESALDSRLQILVSVVEMLTGRKVRFFQESDIQAGETAARSGEARGAESAPSAPEPEFRLRISERTIREEAEYARYAASGTVRTADGRQLDFALELEMARYEYEESSMVLEAGNARPKDPLILNLGTDRVRLLDERFSFDLMSNGTETSLARLGAGSFFLAHDQDGNGSIDSGQELFGPQSGDGFAELSALDEDGNGWIDEGDASFSQLRLWRPDEGSQTLSEAGVGALSLQNRATPYSLKTPQGELAGQLRSTGLYLNENGSVGTLQQIDLMA